MQNSNWFSFSLGVRIECYNYSMLDRSSSVKLINLGSWNKPAMQYASRVATCEQKRIVAWHYTAWHFLRLSVCGIILASSFDYVSMAAYMRSHVSLYFFFFDEIECLICQGSAICLWRSNALKTSSCICRMVQYSGLENCQCTYSQKLCVFFVMIRPVISLHLNRHQMIL